MHDIYHELSRNYVSVGNRPKEPRTAASRIEEMSVSLYAPYMGLAVISLRLSRSRIPLTTSIAS